MRENAHVTCGYQRRKNTDVQGNKFTLTISGTRGESLVRRGCGATSREKYRTVHIRAERDIQLVVFTGLAL